jgi:pimeloyl-ACP methyl ester carboxylesterase
MALELMPVLNRVARAQLVRRGAISRTLVVRGRTLHLLDLPGQGKGPPLIVLHGLGSSALAFAGVLPGLARFSSRVLAADLPGSGFSPLPGDPPDILESVELLSALYARELPGTPAVVVGNSLGGAMAAELAFRHPEQVRALVLSAPAGARLAQERLSALVGSFELKSWRDGRDFMRKLYHRPPLLVPELLARDMIANFASPHVRMLLALKPGAEFLDPASLAALAIPVLLLWGRSERLLPYEAIDYFRAHLPAHAVVEEVEGWGHVPHMDRPREFVARVARFVAELPAA